MVELQSQFLERFLERTKGRLTRARSLLDVDDATALAHELHALAGEAKMLDLFAIADLASRGEVAARAWSDGADDGPRATCATCLDTVGKAVASLSATGGGSP
jgi:HPt (histidine-containing phosphotransfer) domain-containing protein